MLTIIFLCTQQSKSKLGRIMMGSSSLMQHINSMKLYYEHCLFYKVRFCYSTWYPSSDRANSISGEILQFLQLHLLESSAWL